MSATRTSTKGSARQKRFGAAGVASVASVASDHPPRGEQEVRSALIAAAIDLFAQRGPSAVSVRQIAQTAGVNHGLVHHYFGSKDGLLTAALDLLAAQTAHEIAGATGPTALLTAGGPVERHSRILAHLLLDDRDPSEFKTAFPAVQALVSGFRADGLSRREARERAAQVTALVLGWQFFEPFLTRAAGLDVSDRTRTRILTDALALMLR